jgi:hypothetical protein
VRSLHNIKVRGRRFKNLEKTSMFKRHTNMIHHPLQNSIIAATFVDLLIPNLQTLTNPGNNNTLSTTPPTNHNIKTHSKYNCCLFYMFGSGKLKSNFDNVSGIFITMSEIYHFITC